MDSWECVFRMATLLINTIHQCINIHNCVTNFVTHEQFIFAIESDMFISESGVIIARYHNGIT